MRNEYNGDAFYFNALPLNDFPSVCSPCHSRQFYGRNHAFSFAGMELNLWCTECICGFMHVKRWNSKDQKVPRNPAIREEMSAEGL